MCVAPAWHIRRLLDNGRLSEARRRVDNEHSQPVTAARSVSLDAAAPPPETGPTRREFFDALGKIKKEPKEADKGAG
jgi:hypothetical protein